MIGDAAPLTPRQRQVLELKRRGLNRPQIARELGLEFKTVANHLNRAYRRLERGQQAPA